MRKIVEIKTYQHVQFGKDLVSHFNINKADRLRGESLEINLDTNGIVEVIKVDISKQETRVLIPVTNIAYLIPLAEEKVEKVSTKSKSK